MRDRVLNLDTYSFIDSENDVKRTSPRVFNFTDLYIDEDIINDALEEFKNETDIPMCIVIEYEDVVFGNEDYETIKDLLTDEFFNAAGIEDEEDRAIITGDVSELPADESEEETEILSETSEASDETPTENKDI
jgi:hypothetical protein